jgi:hypothetical protein
MFLIAQGARDWQTGSWLRIDGERREAHSKRHLMEKCWWEALYDEYDARIENGCRNIHRQVDTGDSPTITSGLVCQSTVLLRFLPVKQAQGFD